jgi:conserved oligomeric Golgi complex subunit 6
MDSAYFSSLDGISSHDVLSPLSPGGESNSAKKANALSTKVATVLSSSYADSEIREALRQLDNRVVTNDDDLRRNLRLDAQKEVIDANASIVSDFGQVAEVSEGANAQILTTNVAATETSGSVDRYAEQDL